MEEELKRREENISFSLISTLLITTVKLLVAGSEHVLKKYHLVKKILFHDDFKNINPNQAPSISSVSVDRDNKTIICNDRK